jgi:hypothetical protein
LCGIVVGGVQLIIIFEVEVYSGEGGRGSKYNERGEDRYLFESGAEQSETAWGL